MLFEQQTGLQILKEEEKMRLIGNKGHMGHWKAHMGLGYYIIVCCISSVVVFIP